MSKAQLCKQRTWLPNMIREEVWLRRKENQAKLAGRRTKSVTDDDVAELIACIELGFGFGFDSPDMDRKLADTIPALEFYYAVNKQYSRSLSRSSSSSTSMSVDDESDLQDDSSRQLIDLDEDPEMVKTRLKQWAQVVACSVREAAHSPLHLLNQCSSDRYKRSPDRAGSTNLEAPDKLD